MAPVKTVGSAAFAWLAMVASAAAHPGHGEGGGDYGLLHYVIEPQHLLAGVAVSLVSVLCLRHAARTFLARRRLRG
jgi:hydrogenase/urease accessory protein HupE